MNLFARVANVVSFNVLQTFFSKALAFVNFAILVRLLSAEEIGILGLSGGYVALLGFVLILPESVFIRDFVKIKGDINKYLSSFFGFSIVRSLLLLLMAVPVAVWLYFQQQSEVVAAYFLLLVTSTLLTSLTGPFREAFYANFRQARITFVDLILNIVSLSALVILFFSQNILTYGFIQVMVALLGVGWWYWNAVSKLGFSFHLFQGWLTLAWKSVQGFALWNHLSGMAIRLISQADIVILGFFVGLIELGNYAVALTIASVFFVFPQLIQKAVTLSFSQRETNESTRNILGIAIRYNTLFSLAQLGGYILVGPYLVSWLSPANPDVVFAYSVYLATGVTFYNLARPWLALIVAKIDARKFFFELFLIPCLFAVPLYLFFVSREGAIGLAQANIIAYALLSVWTAIYCMKTLHVYPRFQLAPFEKNMLVKVFRKKHSQK